MGIYLNPGNVDFNNTVNHSEIYVDKTELIEQTNRYINTNAQYICISRRQLPHRADTVIPYRPLSPERKRL